MRNVKPNAAAERRSEERVDERKLRLVFAVRAVSDKFGERVVVSSDGPATDLELSCDCAPCRTQLEGAPTTRDRPSQRRQRRQMLAAVRIDPTNPRNVVLDG